MSVKEKFIEHFGQHIGEIEIVQAPARVNVIGEHTDYNDGFVFPAAIDKHMTIVGQLRNDNKIKIYSIDLDEEAEFDLDSINQNAMPTYSWTNYFVGITKLMQERGIELNGMNLAFTSNIPLGSGLSSSAALEIAAAYIIKALHHVEISPIEIVKLCQRAENELVGVNCGIMDQFISCLGQKGQALLIDCRSLDFKPIPLLNPNLSLVVSNTKIKHNLADSNYNQRRQECEMAVKQLSHLTGKDIKALRDVTLEELEQYSQQIGSTIYKRAKHVIQENQRVLNSVEALKDSDLVRFGQLMYQSHQSLKDLYQVSCAELDLMVDLAQSVDGVYGSRMTGGGFGGCTVSLVKNDHVDEFVRFVGEKYLEQTGIQPEFYICDVVDGAEIANSRQEI